MSGWSIEFQTSALNQAILAAQEELTGMLDGLTVLESEAAKLSASWQGESFWQWEAKLEECLREAGVLAEGLKRLISAVYQCACALAQLEQKMAQDAEGW